MLKLLIKEVAENKGLSISDLAKKVGISRASAFNYVSGKTSIQIDVLYKMSIILDTPINELVEGLDSETSVYKGDYAFLLDHLSKMVEILKGEMLSSHETIRGFVKLKKEDIGEELKRTTFQQLDFTKQLMEQQDRLARPLVERAKVNVQEDKLIEEIMKIDEAIMKLQGA